jgi:outer membrane protein insertion porin family
MTLRVHVSALVLVLPLFAADSPRLVKSVSVPGTTLEVNLATQVGRPYDSTTVAKDVRYLWGLGRFDDIRVEAAEDAGGIAVVFHAAVSERVRLHEIRIEPSSFGLEVKLAEGTPLDRARARQIAAQLKKQLERRGYANARVDYEFTPYGREYDLKLKVDAGEAVRVRSVDVAGEPGLQPDDLRGALRNLLPRRLLPGIPHIWNGWKLLPGYSPEAVDSGAAQLLSFLLSRGYFDATVSAPETEVRGKDAAVAFHIAAGPRYTAGKLDIANAWKPAAVCSALFAERREAERRGVLDFPVRMKVDPVRPGIADIATSIEPGKAYRVGRIEFYGNRRFSDAAIRRNLVLDEGAPFDDRLLRRSVARLNGAGWFENIDEKSVAIVRDERTGVAVIRISLTDRKFGKWSISGPVGPASLAGPLEAAIGARLPAWGRGLFELSTYTASLGVFAFAHPLIPLLPAAPGSHWPVVALSRPFAPGQGWLSGFSIAPQVGWRGSALSYAVTQLDRRLTPLLAGDAGLIPDLPVVVRRPAGEAVMMCQAPQPKLHLVRAGAAMALHFAGAIGSF